MIFVCEDEELAKAGREENLEVIKKTFSFTDCSSVALMERIGITRYLHLMSISRNTEVSSELRIENFLYGTIKFICLTPSTDYHSAILCNSSFELIPNETTIPTKSTCRQTNFLTERFV